MLRPQERTPIPLTRSHHGSRSIPATRGELTHRTHRVGYSQLAGRTRPHTERLLGGVRPTQPHGRSADTGVPPPPPALPRTSHRGSTGSPAALGTTVCRRLRTPEMQVRLLRAARYPARRYQGGPDQARQKHLAKVQGGSNPSLPRDRGRRRRRGTLPRLPPIQRSGERGLHVYSQKPRGLAHLFPNTGHPPPETNEGNSNRRIPMRGLTPTEAPHSVDNATPIAPAIRQHNTHEPMPEKHFTNQGRQAAKGIHTTTTLEGLRCPAPHETERCCSRLGPGTQTLLRSGSGCWPPLIAWATRGADGNWHTSSAQNGWPPGSNPGLPTEPKSPDKGRTKT